MAFRVPRSTVPRPRSRRWLTALLLLAAAGMALYLTRAPLLRAAGGLLIVNDALEKADAALVLAGDDSPESERLRAAVRLYKQGWARKIVISGPPTGYGVYESDLALPLTVSLGVPRSDIIPIRHTGKSTAQETGVIAPQLERSGIRSVYVVTTNFHTRRAKRLFIRASGGRMRVLAHSAPNAYFHADRWWESRGGRKFVLLESLKHVNSFLE